MGNIVSKLKGLEKGSVVLYSRFSGRDFVDPSEEGLIVFDYIAPPVRYLLTYDGFEVGEEKIRVFGKFKFALGYRKIGEDGAFYATLPEEANVDDYVGHVRILCPSVKRPFQDVFFEKGDELILGDEVFSNLERLGLEGHKRNIEAISKNPDFLEQVRFSLY